MKAGSDSAAFIRLFGRYLREQGLPVTHQREAVAEVVFGSGKHLSVDEIEGVLRSDGHRLLPYRNGLVIAPSYLP